MNSTRILSSSILTLLALAGVAQHAHGQSISIGAPSVYTENFDSLGTVTNLWNDGVTLPGWYAGINANNTPDGNLQISDGSDGGLVGLLNLGSAGATDRALGTKATSTNGFANIAYGVLFQNTSTEPLRILNIGYAGEMWRTNTAENVERFDTFYKISSTLFTDPEPGPTSAAAAAGTFTPIDSLDWLSPVNAPFGTQFDGNQAANRSELSGNTNLTLAPGEYFMFRWVDTNLANGTDGHIGIDDFTITFLSGTVGGGKNLVYNTAHTLGGAPNGVLSVSPSQYWLDGGNPSGFATGDNPIFSQNATATIDVPANILIGTMTVSATEGTYTIGGAGGITGDLVKSGAGGLILTGANAFGNVTINDGGTIVAQGPAAFSSANLEMTSGATLDIAGNATISGPVTGNGPFTKTGIGSLRLAGSVLPNTYVGTTTVAAGELILSKSAGTVTIPGDLVVESGASVRYTGNNTGDQIADSATITLNGGEFGDVTLNNPTNPGAPETVTDAVINGGHLSTGRAVFTTTNNFVLNGGQATVHRGGTLTVGNLLAVGSTLQVHGGSTTAGQESRVVVGAGGMLMNNGTINFNMGQTVGDTSMGSILALGGNVISTGNSAMVRANTTFLTPKVDIDLQGFDRTFDVTGTLRIGAPGAPVLIQNGGVVKAGTGTLILGGNQIYAQPTTINAGTVQIDGTLASNTVNVGNGGALGGVGTVAGFVTVGNGGAVVPGINGGGLLTISNLVLGSGAADTSSLTFNNGEVPSIIYVSSPSGLTVASGPGTVTVNLTGAVPQLGQMTLVDYELGFTGDLSSFVVGTLPNRVQASVVNDITNTLIALDVTAVDQPVWSGSLNGEWRSTVQSAPKNWVLLSNAATTTDFIPNDSVLFTDLAATNGEGVVPVNVAENVVPASTTFNNFVKPYVLTGTGSIAGTGGLVKEGSGTLTINNTNSFTGGVTINGGSLTVATLADSGVNSALGAGNAITINGDGALEVTGATVSTNRALNVGLVGGALIIPGQLTITGPVSGSGVLAKAGAGKMILTGANTGFNGQLRVVAGAVQYTGGSIGGDAVSVALDGTTLENNDVVETVFNDANTIARTLAIGATGGTISVLNADGAILFDRASGITASGPVTKTGPGVLRVRGAHATLSNTWAVQDGTLEVGALDALGTGQVIVNAGLLASRNVPVQNPITLNGGALGTRSGDLANFQGAVDVLAPSDVILRSYTTNANSQSITISGVLGGSSDLTITGNVPQTNGGNKALILTNTGNTYSGTFHVTSGQFLAAAPATTGNTLGTAAISLEDGGLAIRDDGAGGPIVYNNPITVSGTGTSTIDVNRNAGLSVNNVVQFNNLTIGAQTLAVSGGNGYKAAFSGTVNMTAPATFQPTTADLLIQGTLSGSGFTKSGSGRMDITASSTSTFVGAVTVQEGTLAVNGSTVAGSDITVQGTGTLGGSGTIGGNVIVSAGTLAPGNSAGILNIDGNLTLAAGGLFAVELAHDGVLEAGIDYDQVKVGTAGSSTVTLGGAGLSISVGTGILEDDLFFVLLNDGIDPISGTFASLADNAIFVAGSQIFQISYNADSVGGTFEGGNDIALMAIPEPGSAMLIVGGLFLLAGRRRRA